MNAPSEAEKLVKRLDYLRESVRHYRVALRNRYSGEYLSGFITLSLGLFGERSLEVKRFSQPLTVAFYDFLRERVVQYEAEIASIEERLRWADLRDLR